ncbi:MAG: KEOPS complex subunit Pcc1 [Candidatus Bathyarchaeia archaeon]
MGALRFVVFDLDGVLVDIDSSWEFVHRRFGVNNEENFTKYLKGEIDFKEFMRSDIRLWGKASLETIKSILDSAPIMPGAYEAVRAVKEVGMEPLIVSSGISILADRVASELGINLVYANRLISDMEGRLSGEGEEVVPLNAKDRVLEEVTKRFNATPRNCITVGDSQHDIPFFKVSGLSIAFNAKDEQTKQAADVVVDEKDLRKIIPWITTNKPNKALISLKLGRREAEAVAKSLFPDNIKSPPRLYVGTFIKGDRVIMKVTSLKGVETLLATIDDLLASAELARRAISIADSLL